MFRKWLEGVVRSVYIRCYVVYTAFKVLEELKRKRVDNYGYDPYETAVMRFLFHPALLVFNFALAVFMVFYIVNGGKI